MQSCVQCRSCRIGHSPPIFPRPSHAMSGDRGAEPTPAVHAGVPNQQRVPLRAQLLLTSTQASAPSPPNP